jgi:hypothetical protein
MIYVAATFTKSYCFLVGCGPNTKFLSRPYGNKWNSTSFITPYHKESGDKKGVQTYPKVLKTSKIKQIKNRG